MKLHLQKVEKSENSAKIGLLMSRHSEMTTNTYVQKQLEFVLVLSFHVFNGNGF